MHILSLLFIDAYRIDEHTLEWVSGSLLNFYDLILYHLSAYTVIVEANLFTKMTGSGK